MQRVFIFLRVFFLLLLLLSEQDACCNKDPQVLFEHITLADGLSNSTVNTICQDKRGFIWFGTNDGLQRYDGKTLKTFRNSEDTNSLSNNQIMELYVDSKARLWIGTLNGLNLYHEESNKFTNIYLDNKVPGSNVIRNILEDHEGNIYIGTDAGLYFIENINTHKFDHPHDFNSKKRMIKHGISNSLRDEHITSIIQDNKKNILISTLRHNIHVIDIKSKKTTQINYSKYLKPKLQNIADQPMRKTLFEDSSGDLWIGTESVGMIKWDRDKNIYSNILLPQNKNHVENIPIHCFFEYKQGEIWIGTDGGGIFIYNKTTKSFSNIKHDPGNPKSLSNNVIYDIFADKSGIIWMGTFHSGVNKFTPSIEKFGRVIYDQSKDDGLSYPIVSSIFKDKKGNLWIGTDGGGLNLQKPGNKKIRHFTHNTNNPRSISSNTIISACQDKEDNLWFGTWGGGLNRMNSDGTFDRFLSDSKNNWAVTNDNIWDLNCDNKGRIWIATYGSGINVYLPDKERFYSYIPSIDSINKVQAKTINCLFIDQNNILWVASIVGILKIPLNSYNEDPHKLNYEVFKRDQTKLNDKRVNVIYQDKTGILWFGTNSDGLQKYEPVSKSMKSYTINNGFPNNTIRGILEDDRGNLWVTTTTSLVKLNPETERINVYEEGDGLQSPEFTKAHFKDADGKLYFGGVKGYNAFYPEDIHPNLNIPNVVITGLKLYNKTIEVNQKVNGRVLLNKDISTTNHITLKYDEGFITFEFAALEFTNPSKNQYAYIMDGLEDKWNHTKSRKEAIYTGLAPGTYEFKVKASNNDNVWTKAPASLKITVLPPWWKTWWALLIYIGLLIILLVTLIRFILYQERREHRIEVERLNTEKYKEMTEMKLMFYTNISHEFRTPLTLIIAPLRKLMQQELDAPLHNQIKMIYRNSKRLLRLINQLIDLRKLDKGELKLNPHVGDLVSYVRDICLSFKDYALEKNINLIFKSNVKSLGIEFDKDKIDKILFNLLSNSLKFTDSDGKIEVSLKFSSNSIMQPGITLSSKTDFVEIIVSDTGKGIPEDQLPKIFTRFYQSDDEKKTNLYEGSGIGLSLVKKLVEMHEGTINIESQVNTGTTIQISLPVKENVFTDRKEKVVEEEIEYITSENEFNKFDFHSSSHNSKVKNKTLLIVEDNFELQKFLKNHFADQYNILVAENGKKGWDLCKSQFPDLVISDVMMPEWDGLKLCEMIKADYQTSHIPVLLLTAKTSETHILDGLSKGADDYISKPFSIDILEYKINGIIKNRQKLIDRFKHSIQIEPSEITVTNVDEELMKNALRIVENNLSNSDFTVEKLSTELGMHRGHLSRKLQSVTGKTPIEFIRTIRLKRAAQYLRKSQWNISEICYKVGFSDPVYFRKIFKKEFSQTPSEYKRQCTKE